MHPLEAFRGSGRRIAAVLLTSVMAVVAACGSTASPSPSAAVAASSPPASSAASVEASPSASAPASGSPSASVALPSGLNADTDLEKQLPDELAGAKLTKLSMKGSDFLTAGGAANTKPFTDLLSALGKSTNDFSVAVASSATSGITVVAFRIAGADVSKAVPLFLTAATTNTANASVSDASVGGKSVKKLSAPSEMAAYVYAHGDIMFFVQQQTANEALLNEAFSKLP
jgi:hypothetical protein